MSFERNTAHKCFIADLLKAPFVRKEGYESSYLSTPYGNIARVNLLGAVVSADPTTLILDDGTGKLSVRSFEPITQAPELGSVVLVIGKPRQYREETYVVPEIIKEIKNKAWIAYRKKELSLRKKVQEPVPEQTPKPAPEEQEIKKEFGMDIATQQKPTESSDAPSEIIQFIKQHDTGTGVSLAQLESGNWANKEEVIKRLIAEGELYEIRPGFVKVLE